MDNGTRIRFFRRQIPEFACIPGCHDCCGPVLASTDELARLPRKDAQQRQHALEQWNCVHLGQQGCTVYEQRPLVCRLFGTTPRLACPHGRRPEYMIDPAMDAKIAQFFRQTRHVLV
jgi:Fe-S-cluster containining protein